MSGAYQCDLCGKFAAYFGTNASCKIVGPYVEELTLYAELTGKDRSSPDVCRDCWITILGKLVDAVKSQEAA